MEGATVILRDGGRVPVTNDKVALVNYLRSREGAFVSGQEIAEALGYSRPVIWKDVQYLKDLQYRIEARSKLGYRFSTSPEILHPLEYLPYLKTERMGRTCYYQRVMESTHQMARSLVEQGGPSGTIVCTEYQTKGMGRFGRKWFSPFGEDILCSIISFPAMEAGATSVAPMAVALAVCHAIEEVTGLRINVMWPNDLMYAQKKLGGILVDAGFTGGEVSWMIASLGLNVNSRAEEFPRGVRETLTTLADLKGESQSRSRVLAAVLAHLEQTTKKLEEGAAERIVQQWRSFALFIGEPVTILFLNGEIKEGTAADVDAQGRLEFQSAEGIRLVSAAEVMNIRPLAGVSS
jgi:BirA family biotin operon repressor/biotin-[acetyl-CoA-carboxylase] ligase